MGWASLPEGARNRLRPGVGRRGTGLELGDYLRIIRRRWWLIALSLAVCAGTALLYSFTRTSVYQASAEVFIGPRIVQRSSLTQALEELTFSGEFMASYARRLGSRTIAERVVKRLNLNVAPGALREQISTSVVPETRIIEIRVTDGSPAQAALIANTVVEVFIPDVRAQFGGGSVQATLVEPAIAPSSRASPLPVRDGILGGILGLLLGVGGAVMLEQLDTRLHTRDDVERTLHPLPILVAVPRLSAHESRRRHLVMEYEPRGAVAETFRILRTAVQFLAVDRPIRRLLIAGALEGDGKTTVAVNLASSFAATGCRTLLMETDLRQPTVHEYIGAKPSPGISDLLLGRSTLHAATRSTAQKNLKILPSGTLPPNPSELLGGQRMVAVIEEASAAHDLVILDTPPTLPVTDALVLAPRADGIIIVVRSGRTSRNAARAMAEQFARAGGRVLGVVFNAADGSTMGYDYHHYGQMYGDDESAQTALPQPALSGHSNRLAPARSESTLDPLADLPHVFQPQDQPAAMRPRTGPSGVVAS